MTDIEQLNALRNEYNDRIALIARVREQNPIIVNNLRAAYNNYINTINNEIIECKDIELFNFENSVGKENIFSLICMKY